MSDNKGRRPAIQKSDRCQVKAVEQTEQRNYPSPTPLVDDVFVPSHGGQKRISEKAPKEVGMPKSVDQRLLSTTSQPAPWVQNATRLPCHAEKVR